MTTNLCLKCIKHSIECLEGCRFANLVPRGCIPFGQHQGWHFDPADRKCARALGTRLPLFSLLLYKNHSFCLFASCRSSSKKCCIFVVIRLVIRFFGYYVLEQYERSTVFCTSSRAQEKYSSDRDSARLRVLDLTSQGD